MKGRNSWETKDRVLMGISWILWSVTSLLLKVLIYPNQKIGHKASKIQRTSKYNYLLISQKTWQTHPKSKHSVDWLLNIRTSVSHNFGQTYWFLGKTSSSHILGSNILLYSLEGAKIGWTLWPLVRMKQIHFYDSPQFPLINLIVNAWTSATGQMTVPVLGCPF